MIPQVESMIDYHLKCGYMFWTLVTGDSGTELSSDHHMVVSWIR